MRITYFDGSDNHVETLTSVDAGLALIQQCIEKRWRFSVNYFDL